jgi:hypothetical protein
MISNEYFNHSRTTSLQYGLSSEAGANLFIMGQNGVSLRVHPRTLESAFAWSQLVGKALENGVDKNYLPNEKYERPFVGRFMNLKQVKLPELTPTMIRKALSCLGKLPWCLQLLNRFKETNT